jgi:hypothetical protein
MAQQFKGPVIEDFEADDIRAFYDSSVLRVWHLGGKPKTYRIHKVQRITTEFRSETSQRAALTLVDRDGVVQLPMVLNPTNRNTIQQLYGTKPSAWVGQCITLYPTTTEMAGKTVDCIRVRPTVPGKAASAPKNKQGVTVARPAAPPPAATNGAEQSDADDSDAEADAEPEDDEPPIGALETDRESDVIQ